MATEFWVEAIKLPGPVQEKVAPGVEETPVIGEDVLPQVMTPPLALAFGAAKSPATTAVVLAVQLFGPVTTKV